MPRVGMNFRYFADWAEQLQHEDREIRGHRERITFDPAGVVAIITPWNAPLMLATWRIGPALAAGNTVVVKPPEWAPLTASLLAEITHEAGLPPGVFNVVQGTGAEAGAPLTRHPGINRLSFTGSVPTAGVIAAAAAPNIVPLSFELGGKSPLVVFEDSDLDLAVDLAVEQFDNAGQVCLGAFRLLVHESIADDFLGRVVERASGLVQGDPRDEATDVSALVSRTHFERVSGFVDRAIADGAKPVLGGGPNTELGGLFFRPTILTGAQPGSEILTEEVFGPVLTVQTFATEDEAVEMANNTRFGLAATLVTGDPERAERVSAALNAGTVWVNCFFVRDLGAPFGGNGKSGIGREGGDYSFDFYCDIKNSVFSPSGWTAGTNERTDVLMGEVVGAGLIAHVPTIVLPEATRRELNGGEDSTLVSGLQQLRSEVFDTLDYDTVVVLDSHWATTVEFVVTAQERRAGLFTSEELPRGMSQRPYDFPGDPELAHLIAGKGVDHSTWITAIEDDHLPIFYATTNVWEFLGQGLPDKRWISIGVCQTADMEDNLRLGRALGDAIAESDRKVLLIASGAMSHTFWPLRQLRDHEAAGREHIFTKEAIEADHERLEWFRNGDHAQVLDTMPEFYRFRPEARFGHYLMMIGALGEGDCTATSRQYGEYENSIGTAQVHLWFDRPEEGFPRPRRTPTDPDFVRQNAGPDLPAAG